MEFVEGVKINDKAGLEKLNISPKAVRENLIDIFTTMIFQYGYVHCDAHPGNILVRKQNNRLRHEIILLDHGLYRTIRPETIRSFSGLWLSLMMGDTKQVEHYAKDLNIERHLEYLPIIFLQRTKNSCKPIGANFTLSERK